MQGANILKNSLNKARNTNKEAKLVCRRCKG